MEERTQKLLILVGDEGPALEARDFGKLNEVIVENYLATNNQLYEENLKQMLLKATRRIPLKQHIYAALTAKIQNAKKNLSSLIIEESVQLLQQDLNNLRFYEATNLLIYLAELMNLSLLNSLSFFNLIDDLVASIQSAKNPNIRLFLISVFSRSLPTFAYSLNEKVYHDFKKLLEKAKKICYKNQIFSNIMEAHQRGNLQQRSMTSRLDFQQTHLIEQIQYNFKLTIEENKIEELNLKFTQCEYILPSVEESEKLFQDFFKNQGIFHMHNIEMIIELMSLNSAILIQKIVSYINGNKSFFMEKFVVEVIIGKALKSRNPIVEPMILVKLMQADHIFKSIIEESFIKIFHRESENFDFEGLICFANAISLVANNWVKGQDEQHSGWDWEKFVLSEQVPESSLKKKVLIKLIFQKMVLLCDRFTAPSSLVIYAPPDDTKSKKTYKNLPQMQKQEQICELLKNKSSSEVILESLTNESDYEIFLECLFERTSMSHTHLEILMTRYQDVFEKNKKENDWTLVTKIRSFWRKSLFHRLLYLSFVFEKNYVDFTSYVKYISKVQTEYAEEQLWIKLELSELNNRFGGKIMK